MNVDHRERLTTGYGQRERLGAVVVEHQLADLVGHLDQQLVALFDRHRAFGHHGTEEDLDVDLVVAAVDAGRVVDGVGVDEATVEGELDSTSLGEAEVAAFADHSTAQLRSVDAQAVVGTIADVGVGLGRGLDVGADATVPQARRPEHAGSSTATRSA